MREGGVPAHTFSGKRLTVTLRELERLNIVPEMKAHPDRVSAIADSTAGGKTYPAVQYKSDHGTFVVMFDPVTNVNPAMVAVVRGVEKMGIKPERFAGGHGAVGNYADLERAVQNSAAR